MSDDIENCIFISTNVYLLSAEWENAIIEKSEEKQKSNTENEEKLKKLKLEIKKKINEEKYEEAAKIRDEIKKLEENQIKESIKRLK